MLTTPSKLKVCACALAIANAGLFIELADHGASAQNGAQPVRRVGPPKLLRQEPLTQMPSPMPIPMPPDAKFIAGYRDQYSTTKLTTDLRFRTANSAAAIRDWYKQSLTATGWTVSAPPAGKSMTAYRSQMFCTLNFLESTQPAGTQQTAPSTVVILNYSGDRM